jgi:hypothetical protein
MGFQDSRDSHESFYPRFYHRLGVRTGRRSLMQLVIGTKDYGKLGRYVLRVLAQLYAGPN